MMKAAGRRGFTCFRQRALVCVLWRTGMRISEALALRPKDIDLDSGVVHVLHGKGDKRRTLALDASSCEVVRSWMVRRERISCLKNTSPVFCSLRGRPLRPSSVHRNLCMLAQRAGIEKRVHPHGLRHTFATELVAEGVPLDVISQALGHARISTTAVYIAKIAAPEVVRALRNRPNWTEKPPKPER